MCRRQFSKPRIEDVFIKGTGLRTKLDVRRVWKCPHCERTVKLRGRETSKTCNCGGETRFMELQEGLRWTRPHQPIKAVTEVRPDPDEFPDPPKQELPVEPEIVDVAEVSDGAPDIADTATPIAEEEGLITSSLPSISEVLSAEDDGDDDTYSSVSTESPAEEKSRPGRKRRRRRRRKRGGEQAEGKSGSEGEAIGVTNTGTTSAATENTDAAEKSEDESTGAPKKKRRRRRRRRKKPEGSSGGSSSD